MAVNDPQGGDVNDDQIEHKLGCKVLYPASRAGLAEDNTGLGVGGQIEDCPVADAEVTDFAMTTADDVYFLMDLAELWDADLREDLHAELLLTSQKAGATTGVAMTVNAKGVAAGTAMTDAKVAPDGTAAFTGLGVAATGAPAETGRKPLNCAGAFATFTDTNKPRKRVTQDALVIFAVTCVDDGDAAADDVRVQALRIWYTREMCDHRARRQTT